MGLVLGVVSFLLVSASAVVPLSRSRGSVSVNYIGEGGGAVQIDPVVGGHWERETRGETGVARGDGRAPEPRRYDSWQSRRTPAGSEAAVGGPLEARRPVTRVPAQPPVQKKPEAPPRYALWEGLAAPLRLPSAKAREVPPDEARDLVSRDYDEHVLGEKKRAAPRLILEAALPRPMARSAAFRRTSEAALPRPMARSDAPATTNGSEMFVAVELDLKDRPGELKDAVADLARVAGFRQDPRFEPAAQAGRVSVWGWLGPERLGEAMRSRGVTRLQIDGTPRRGSLQGATTEVLLGIRLPDAGAAPRVEARILAELSADAGYRHLRTLGVQSAPGTKAPVLVLSGEVPVRELSRLMGRGDVVKLISSPAPLPPEPQPAPAPAPGPTGFKAFVAFAATRSPILLIVTLLMMVPSVGLGLVRCAEIFVPYRR